MPLFHLPGSSTGLKPINQGSLTIQGLHLTMLSFRKMSFFTDKKEIQRSATALAYVAHVSFSISLVFSCLGIDPLMLYFLVAFMSYFEIHVMYLIGIDLRLGEE